MITGSDIQAASVPGISTDNATISTTVAGPNVSGQVETVSEKKTNAAPDFVPGVASEIEVPADRKRTFVGLSHERGERVYVDRSVDSDYIPPEENAKRNRILEAQIKDRAKPIWSSTQKARAKFTRCKNLVNAATDEQLEKPTKEQQLAQETVSRGEPMTKEKAFELARREVMEARLF